MKFRCLIFSALLTLNLGAEVPNVAERFAVLKQAYVSQYGGGNPTELHGQVQYLEARLNEMTRSYEQEQAATDQSIGQLRQEIDALQDAITNLDTEIQDQRIPAARRMKLVQERNALVGRLNPLIPPFNQQVNAVQTRRNALAREINNTQKQLNESINRYNRLTDQQEAWVKSGQSRSFWGDLDQLQRELVIDARVTGLRSNYLTQVKELRKELHQLSLLSNKQNDSGHFLTEVTLGKNVKGLFLLDTGATMLTITPALAEELGLFSTEGVSSHMTIADGTTLEVKRITIPSVTVLGKTAYNVEAVIMNGPSVGKDGLLGQSFLRNFIYTVNPNLNPPLILTPLN
jgi:clan AA aspartic protease (TIGR02281 family)